MTIEQVKAARALLKWTAADLATDAKIGAATVRRYESGSGVLSAAKSAIYNSLTEAGIQFLNGGSPGVRLKKVNHE